jgi:MoaA/NifB/PqqE/SkfB family radical SAM enzyme
VKKASFDYILKTVHQSNILPVTSACRTACIFCSHKNNPQDVEAYMLPALSLEEIKQMIAFLDGEEKIVIGESASRIMEGEPFIREDIMDILQEVRRVHPSTVIEITTSGMYMDSDKASRLKKLEPLEVNLSINSSSPEGRNLLHGNAAAGAAEAVGHLKDSGVKFNGSIVAMPQIVGYGDIEDTIGFLSSSGAGTIRVFVPGFSKFAHSDIDFFGIREKLHSIADSAYARYGVPVLVEPPYIKDLDCDICGIIKDSPAQRGSLLKGDIILTVDGYKPSTRVDAYNAIWKAMNPHITFMRNASILETRLDKPGKTSAGAVFYYDLHPQDISAINETVKRYRSQSPIVVTSRLGYPLLKMGMEKMGMGLIPVCAVDNNYFGGTIMCTGLLTAEDIIMGIRAQIEKNCSDLIILPCAPFDTNGRDLSGHYYYEIEDALGVRSVIAE